MAIIRAAGGLLWRAGRDGHKRLAVIHRPHRDDWSLPKGKLKDGEHWEQAALREVFEETGCTSRIVSFAGCMHYVPKRTPKLVLFWNMELVEEGPLQFLDEVDEVRWLTRREALKRLDHDTEREVLVEALELTHFSAPELPSSAAARLDRSADDAFFESGAAAEATREVIRAAAERAGPDAPPPLELEAEARARVLRPALATAVAMAGAGLGAFLLGPPRSIGIAVAAAALGGLAAGGSAVWTRAVAPSSRRRPIAGRCFRGSDRIRFPRAGSRS
jgi:8-oxo-dGTP diphosphatase